MSQFCHNWMLYWYCSLRQRENKMQETLLRAIARQVKYFHSSSNGNEAIKHEYALESLMKHMPSGSGIDAGTKLLLSESSADKLVFEVAYHHMDDNGYYCGWTTRNIIITAGDLNTDYDMDFQEVSNDADFISIDEETGEEFDNSEFALETTDDYLADTFRYALEQEVTISMADFEPTCLTIHGELVKS